MATGLRQIQRDLFDALRGRNGDDAETRSGNGTPADAPGPSNGAGARAARRRERERTRHGTASGTGGSIFQDVRARAREVVQGFREGRAGAGDRLRSLREEPGRDGDGTGTLRRGGGASISPPWRRTPTLPEPPGPPPPGRGKPRLKKLRLALVILGLTLLAMVSWFFGIMMSVAQDLPALENREQFKNAENSTVVDRTGRQVATLTGNQRRILIPSEQISQTVKQAVVAIEDQRFYEHRGIDFQGIGRAIIQDVLSQDTTQGASTITQQFVKNALRAQDSRTIFQKLREAALAYHLERRWSKDKILTEYLNSIYFGEGAYGIEAAARTYFGWNHPGCGGEENRCASALEPQEAALLAGMISSPTAYSPRSDPEAATERRNLVLQKMVEQGVLTEEQYAEIVGDGSKENPGIPIPTPGQIEPPKENSAAPYFTSWLQQQIVDRYGAGEAFGGGLRIQSTLDLEYQQAVEQIAYGTLAGIEPTASVVVLDNDTGGVLAMVGGTDFDKEPFNLATNGHRQPGSSFKPFTLVSALEQGHSPEEVYSSQPKTFDFKVPGYKKPQVFEVHNYEDQYLGSASIATATQYSDNSVYAELGLQVGTDYIARTAQDMGIQTKLSTNPAMILGGLETGVSPLEMTYAFSTLGRSGARIGGTMDSVPGSQLGPLGIMQVTREDDGDGDDVEDKTGASGNNEVQTDQVIDAGAADTAVDLLENVVSAGTGEAAATGDFAWGKTGTTDDNGDAWFCGGTEDITSCVWVGHADEVVPMTTDFGGAPVDGGTYPAEIWHDVVLAYDSIIGHDGENDDGESSTTDTGSTGTYGAPVAPTTTTPAAPTAPAPTETPPPAPDQTTPAAPPTGGGTTDGGTGATGAG